MRMVLSSRRLSSLEGVKNLKNTGALGIGRDSRREEPLLPMDKLKEAGSSPCSFVKVNSKLPPPPPWWDSEKRNMNKLCVTTMQDESITDDNYMAITLRNRILKSAVASGRLESFGEGIFRPKKGAVRRGKGSDKGEKKKVNRRHEVDDTKGTSAVRGPGEEEVGSTGGLCYYTFDIHFARCWVAASEGYVASIWLQNDLSYPDEDREAWEGGEDRENLDTVGGIDLRGEVRTGMRRLGAVAFTIHSMSEVPVDFPKSDVELHGVTDFSWRIPIQSPFDPEGLQSWRPLPRAIFIMDYSRQLDENVIALSIQCDSSHSCYDYRSLMVVAIIVHISLLRSSHHREVVGGEVYIIHSEDLISEFSSKVTLKPSLGSLPCPTEYLFPTEEIWMVQLVSAAASRYDEGSVLSPHYLIKCFLGFYALSALFVEQVGLTGLKQRFRSKKDLLLSSSEPHDIHTHMGLGLSEIPVLGEPLQVITSGPEVAFVTPAIPVDRSNIEEAQDLSRHARVTDPTPMQTSSEVANPRLSLAPVETRPRRPGKEPMQLDGTKGRRQLDKGRRLPKSSVEEKIVINDNYPEQLVTIGGGLSAECRHALIHTLRKNVDIFTWTLADMTGIPRALTEHILDTYPHIEPKA
ncbi:hypothetical protein Tco_1295419 [Tanacetum coccineum]